MKRKYLLSFIILTCFVLIGLYVFQWRERSLSELQSYATDELEFAYGRKLSSQFIGPSVENETRKDVRFYWFKVDGCDTTNVFIRVPKRGISEPEVSSITKGCN